MQRGGVGLLSVPVLGPKPCRKSRGDPAAQLCGSLGAEALAAGVSWELGSV